MIGEETSKDVAYFRLEDKIYKKLDNVHNSTIGHLGVDKMLMKLKRIIFNGKVCVWIVKNSFFNAHAVRK